MKVGWVWAVYIIVVAIVFLLLAWSQMSKVGRGTAAFVALLVGAAVVFVASMSVERSTLNKTEQGWFSALMVIAYILPVFAIIYVAWSGEYRAMTRNECSTEKSIVCDTNTNICTTVQETRTCGAEKTNTFFL